MLKNTLKGCTVGLVRMLGLSPVGSSQWAAPSWGRRVSSDSSRLPCGIWDTHIPHSGAKGRLWGCTQCPQLCWVGVRAGSFQPRVAAWGPDPIWCYGYSAGLSKQQLEGWTCTCTQVLNVVPIPVPLMKFYVPHWNPVLTGTMELSQGMSKAFCDIRQNGGTRQ